jgi:hypothetical protein
VTLTTEQRTKIRQTVLVSAPRASNVNFALRVGTRSRPAFGLSRSRRR